MNRNDNMQNNGFFSEQPNSCEIKYTYDGINLHKYCRILDSKRMQLHISNNYTFCHICHLQVLHIQRFPAALWG